MTILTWNCCLPPWSISRKLRLSKIVSAILSANADIVCLQEVFFRKDGELIAAELKKFGFQDSFHFKNLLIVSKFLLNHKQEFLFESQGPLVSWAVLDRLYKKGFQMITIQYDNQTIFLFHAHLLSATGSEVPAYQNVRARQIEQINILADKPQNIVIGDFNFNPGTFPYQKMVSFGFSDPFAAAIATTKTGRKDYIFLKGLASQTVEVVFQDKKLSNHAGLIIKI
jgi:endonuclease/exonuclease/phosphatase family metal-dependent hydrolase